MEVKRNLWAKQQKSNGATGRGRRGMDALRSRLRARIATRPAGANGSESSTSKGHPGGSTRTGRHRKSGTAKQPRQSPLPFGGIPLRDIPFRLTSLKAYETLLAILPRACAQCRRIHNVPWHSRMALEQDYQDEFMNRYKKGERIARNQIDSRGKFKVCHIPNLVLNVSKNGYTILDINPNVRSLACVYKIVKLLNKKSK